MKFSSQMDIKARRDRVVELFRNPDNLAKWQDGFQGIEHVSGQPGETGAQKKMFYSNNGQDLELLETITDNSLPDEFSALYQHVYMENTMTSRFVETDGGKATRFICEVEYTKFNGIMPRLMAWFFPGMFRKQAQKWFDQFKAYAESDQP
ncbi:MAG: SRPBCC family protein [Planctomycetota bacterium]